jgi:hypothetical protein
MEINEIVTYFLNMDTNIIEVSFRTMDDADDVIRIDNIDFSIAEDYGFDLIVEDFDFFGDEFYDEIEGVESKVDLDEDELITFLNEYYIVHPELLPKPELF